MGCMRFFIDSGQFPIHWTWTVKFNIEFCEKRHFTSYEQRLSLEQVVDNVSNIFIGCVGRT